MPLKLLLRDSMFYYKKIERLELNAQHVTPAARRLDIVVLFNCVDFSFIRGLFLY